MRKVWKFVAGLAAVVTLLISAVGSDKTPQQIYIATYSELAVSEMYRSGVPASITLAQGLLESRAGLSDLAAKGNNHFGIKCHDWKGRTMKVDDDRKGECFRVYDSADQSFRDHSDFLRYRDRYKFLFENDVTDYKAWAHGLKKAGYATDPAYPSKLIRIIEEYGLNEYDTMKVSDLASTNTKPEKKKKDRHRRHKVVRVEVPDEIPESPLSIEEPKPVEKGRLEEFRFSLSRQMYSKNGVPFIRSVEGESYESIAAAYNLFLKEILIYNDVETSGPLAPGTVVYLQAKKNQSAPGLDKYIVDDSGVSLRDIAQRFGIKLKSIKKMNGIEGDYTPREGDTILLRAEGIFNKFTKNAEN
ncbi:MAG: glucosaminidase domain-containing protein [Bacteroidales bacterium]|nr:glucosaminidase domain-containing protein [Bacteroidales bacterium]